MENIDLTKVIPEVIEDIRSKFSKASEIVQSMEKVQAQKVTLYKDIAHKLSFIAKHMKPGAKQSQMDKITIYMKELPPLQEKITELIRVESKLMGEFVVAFGQEDAQYFPENKTGLAGYV